MGELIRDDAATYQSYALLIIDFSACDNSATANIKTFFTARETLLTCWNLWLPGPHDDVSECIAAHFCPDMLRFTIFRRKASCIYDRRYFFKMMPARSTATANAVRAQGGYAIGTLGLQSACISGLLMLAFLFSGLIDQTIFLEELRAPHRKSSNAKAKCAETFGYELV